MRAATRIDAPVKSPLGWHLLGGFLVAAWIAVLGVMFTESAGTGDALDLSAADFSGRLEDEDSWLGAYSQGRKLGYVHSRIRATEDAYTIEQHTFLKMRLAGTNQEISSRFTADLGRDFQLEKFRFQFRSGVLSARADGRMQGDRLVVEARIGSDASKLSLPLDAPPLFDLTVLKLLAARELKAGERYRVQVFDPQSLSNRPVEIEVVGLEVVKVRGEMEPSVHLRRTLAGQPVDTWIDAGGAVLQEKTAFGLTLRREEPEAARELPPDDQAGEIDATELLRLLAPASPGTDPSAGASAEADPSAGASAEAEEDK
jgi:hypothetical protein